MPGTPRIPSVPKSSLGMSEESLTCGAWAGSLKKKCNMHAGGTFKVAGKEIVRHKARRRIALVCYLVGNRVGEGNESCQSRKHSQRMYASADRPSAYGYSRLRSSCFSF